MNVNSVKLPYYFYDLNAVMPNGTQRWFDEFSGTDSSVIHTPSDFDPEIARRKMNRNIAYSRWQAAFFRVIDGQPVPEFTPKQLKWQAIRVLSFAHSEKSHKDWWENYQDAVFRVFVNPETVYCHITGEHKQWYLLSPEDGYLVNRHELEKDNPALAPRNYQGHERWLSANPLLRRARFIPVECCHHLRHETTAGVLPEGL